MSRRPEDVSWGKEPAELDDRPEANDVGEGSSASRQPTQRGWKQIFILQDDPETTLLASYRYLRLAIPTVVVTLFVSIFLERAHATCWNGSVSAYYYSPVHSVLRGSACRYRGGPVRHPRCHSV